MMEGLSEQEQEQERGRCMMKEGRKMRDGREHEKEYDKGQPSTKEVKRK